MEMKRLKEENDLPLIIANAKGLILGVNQPFEDLFLWKEAEIIEHPLAIIIPPRMRDAHHCGFSRFLLTETPTLLSKPIVLMAINKRGEEFEAEHVIHGQKEGDEWIFWATIKPMK